MDRVSRSGQHRFARLCGVLAVAVSLAGALPAAACAREILVANGGASSVSVIDGTANQVVGTPIGVGLGPFGIAIVPDGTRAYVANIDIGEVRVLDIANRQVVGPPIEVGGGPYWIAIAPDGTKAYVADGSTGTVAVIDTQTNQAGTPIAVGEDPEGIAITPDGTRAYVANYTSNDVSVIDLQTDKALGAAIKVGSHPRSLAIAPDGQRAYVANDGAGSVSVIDTQTNEVVGSPIGVGAEPKAVAVSPDGLRAYVVNHGSASVSVINTQTNKANGAAIGVGAEPTSAAVTPDGRYVYVTNAGPDTVSAIDTQTNQVVGAPIEVGGGPQAIAIVPDQGPTAAFDDPFAVAGLPAAFDATASSDPDGSVARFDWSFGDGQSAADGGPRPTHTYASAGNYLPSLTVTDNEGCSTAFVFTGQTASCNGSARASTSRSLPVAAPRPGKLRVRLHCPKRAKPGGCKFKVRAFTKKRKGKAETKVTRARIKAGGAKLVVLKPRPRFAARLAKARKALLKQTRTIRGKRKTYFRRLKLVR